jgi:hypothetical protein
VHTGTGTIQYGATRGNQPKLRTMTKPVSKAPEGNSLLSDSTQLQVSRPRPYPPSFAVAGRLLVSHSCQVHSVRVRRPHSSHISNFGTDSLLHGLLFLSSLSFLSLSGYSRLPHHHKQALKMPKRLCLRVVERPNALHRVPPACHDIWQRPRTSKSLTQSKALSMALEQL